MGDAALLRARIEGGQDYVYAVRIVFFHREKYQCPCGITRCFLLEAVLAGAASGAAAARSVDWCRDGGPAGSFEPVLDAADPQDGEEDAVSETT